MNKSLRAILADLYLDYVNNYLTVEKFAEHHEISKETMISILIGGRDIHEQNCQK